MTQRILTARVSSTSLVALRDRTRQVGELFGLDKSQRTRFITAVSEIARNTVQYASEGNATFLFKPGGTSRQAQQVIVQMQDNGPGIADLAGMLAGRPNSRGQVPLGIAGSRRLVDDLRIECPAGGGTLVTISMTLAKNAALRSTAEVEALVRQFDRRKPHGPLEELEQQHRELLHTLAELRLRQLELQQADERKNQFLATLAHELRSPLGTLKMTLEIIKRKGEVGADELAQRCAVMVRQTEQLARLVDDLMDVTRVTHGKVELDKQPAEVNELVKQAVEMCGAAIEIKHHALASVLHAEELWIQGDPSRLIQVLCNLIQNAARYTPERGSITVSVRRANAYAVVEVADSGIGIAPGVLPHIFDMFVQGTAGAKGNKGGLGVGLTLVKRLTEDHGGTVAAASAGLGQGSRFTVTLPLASVPERVAA